MTSTLLEVKNLTKEFNGVVANNNVSLEIEEEEIVGLIGPNGAGKTTLFNCIVGYHQPNSGVVLFKGKDITNWPPPRVAKAGIARTFQIMRLMGNLTVEQNALIGAFCRLNNRRAAKNKARKILELVGLIEKKDLYPTELPVATQKRIELSRALATEPELLMLDEVAAGLNPQETKEIIQILRRIHKEKELTLFLTEHVMEFISLISERVLVLSSGEKIAAGSPDEVLEEEQVIQAYLGKKYAKSE